MRKAPEKPKDFVRKNEQIRISPVRVVRDGSNLGVMPTYQALNLARSLDLDLVEVAPNSRPPVCALTDFGKFMFERSKKDRDKKVSKSKEKEVSFRYVIDNHDLETKANQVRRFLEKGFRTKVTVKFKARENAHRDKGFEVIQRLMGLLGDVAVPEKPPALEGANVVVRLDAKKGPKKNEQTGSGPSPVPERSAPSGLPSPVDQN